MYTGTCKLYNDVIMPGIALGTSPVPNDEAILSVKAAIEVGYRHIDTAIAYGNENGCAKGIISSGVNRKEIFITTKIPSHIKSYEEAKEAINSSLERLETTYIDQMLIHAPKPWNEMPNDGYRYTKENLEVWKALEEAYNDGLIRSIGLSNFNVSDMENIVENCAIKPMVNQLCAYISHMPEPEIEYCAKNNILITGYSPIARGKLLGEPQITQMAEKYGVSLPQLCIRYLIERNILPLPKTVHKEYMISNADVDFEISQEDVEILTNFKIEL